MSRSFGLIVEAELCYGVERAKDPTKERMIVGRFLSPFKIAPFDSRCAERYGRIRATLASKGKTIAGTANMRGSERMKTR